jgi:hypothetical protein
LYFYRFSFLNFKYTPENYFILECEKSGPKSVVHKRRSSRLRKFSKRKTISDFWCHALFMQFPKYTSAFYEGILRVCLIWGSGREAVSHAQMDARSVIHNAFFCSHTSHRSHHSHTIHWISIVSFNKLWYCHILYCMKNTCVSSIWSVFKCGFCTKSFIMNAPLVS